MIAELEAGGWVKPVGVVKGGVGRNAVNYEVAGDAAYSLGVDLGGTKSHRRDRQSRRGNRQ